MVQQSYSFSEIPESNKQEFYDFLKKQSQKSDKVEKNFLSEARISHFYGCNVLALYLPQSSLEIVAFISYKKTRDNYINIYFIYTSPEYRGNGLQKELIKYVLKKEKPNRIYSLASTIHSVLFYYKQGYDFWGYTKKNELVMDTLIDNNNRTEPTKAEKILKKHGYNIGCKFSEKMVADFIMKFYKDFV